MSCLAERPARGAAARRGVREGENKGETDGRGAASFPRAPIRRRDLMLTWSDVLVPFPPSRPRADLLRERALLCAGDDVPVAVCDVCLLPGLEEQGVCAVQEGGARADGVPEGEGRRRAGHPEGEGGRRLERRRHARVHRRPRLLLSPVFALRARARTSTSPTCSTLRARLLPSRVRLRSDARSQIKQFTRCAHRRRADNGLVLRHSRLRAPRLAARARVEPRLVDDDDDDENENDENEQNGKRKAQLLLERQRVLLHHSLCSRMEGGGRCRCMQRRSARGQPKNVVADRQRPFADAVGGRWSALATVSARILATTKRSA